MPQTETLTTDDIADEFSVTQRTAQNYVKALAEKDRVILESGGKPNHWKLAETEPSEPVYDVRLAKAKRWANRAAKVGRLAMLLGLSILASAGLITSNHIYAESIGVYIPFVTTDTASTAVLTGVAGSAIFAIAFVTLLFSVALPRVVEWYIDDSTPDSR